VTLPPGQQEAVHVTAVAGHISQSNDIMWGSDTQIGPVYDFVAGKEPSSAVVSFKVDPSRLPAAVGVPNASPVGLSIQVFEPAVGSWIPLQSTYNAKSHTVTATSPHLSWFSLHWFAVAVSAACAAGVPDACGAIAIADSAKALLANALKDFWDAWSPAQVSDDCAKEADKAWKVESSVRQLSGCVIDSPGSSPVIQVENPLLLPMVIRPPAGAPHAGLADQPFLTGAHPDLSSLLTGLMDWTLNRTVIGPRSYGVVSLHDLPESGAVTMPTQPDLLALVMDAVLSILFALPGEDAVAEAAEKVVVETLPEFIAEVNQEPGSVTLGDILGFASKKAMQRTSNAEPAFTLLTGFSDAYECASENIGDVVKDTKEYGVISGVLDAALNLGEHCVETAYAEVGKDLGQHLEDVLDVLDAIPNFAKTVRETVQFFELGPQSMTAVTTAAPTAAPAATFTVCTTPTLPCSGSMKTEPTGISPATDGAGYLKGLTWSGWGTAVAVGTGTAERDNCVPNCGQGTYSAHSATVTLSHPTPYGKGLHDYSTMVIDQEGTPFSVEAFTGLTPSATKPTTTPASAASIICTGAAVTPDCSYPSAIITQPASILISSYDGATADIQDLTWSDWGSATAVGTAIAQVGNNCVPTCTEGTYHVTVTMSDPAPLGKGHQAYSMMVIRVNGTLPRGPYSGGGCESPCTTTTGQCACWAQCWLTDPSSIPGKPPWPRQPTTRRSAPTAASSSTGRAVPRGAAISSPTQIARTAWVGA
jgi:hypothetical protein